MKKADFGVSVLLEAEELPESGNNSEFSAGFSENRADIWALGVTLFAFTYNVVPFDGDTVLEILDSIEKNE